MKKIILLSSFCLLFIGTRAKDKTREIDSVINLLKTDKEDTAKIHHLTKLSTSFDYAGKLDEALNYGAQACDLAEKLGRPDEIANARIDLGNAYYDKGLYPQALDQFLKAQKISEVNKLKVYLQMATSALGLIYLYTNDYVQALDNNIKALKMAKDLEDSSEMAVCTSNIGTVYFSMKDMANAEKYFRKSMEIDKGKHNGQGIAADINNLGSVFMAEHNDSAALRYFLTGYKLDQRFNDISGIITNGGDIGEAYMHMKKYDMAEKYLREALGKADSAHYTDYVKSCSQDLSQLYEETGRWEEAYKAYTNYAHAKDSLVNESKSKEIGRIEAKSDYDKQLALQHAEVEKKQALADAENKKQRLIIWFIAAIALAVAAIALVIFRSLKTTRQQKLLIESQKMEVETQKTLVEEKNKEVLDSITYAKQLQDAILPREEDIKKMLPESFLLYKPKAIVAGDFYWMHSLLLPTGEGRGEVKLIAACDCTGHGVPGAMVSVVCSNALDRAVKEFGLREPDKILDKVRELVVETFEKSDSDVKDGMDVSLCSITPLNPGEELGVKLDWSGAFNPLWYMQNGELKEITADKQPIGKTDNPKPFTLRTLSLNKGDGIYLFTDGYADQFGGPKGKKFKYKQLQQLLIDNYKLSMNEQKKILEKTFEDWKGDLEQTDDLCIIGIRI
jgi:serine phosphatase RsbU (regulator of sigma subunit)